ncbi:MAG: putative dissimilatory sulfite reductase subunit [Peptococcaceae bacterium]|jgi:Mn-dependent DtxR family transcriptional regulator|nr:putative dissimilatory sulfite reductase subunit [Peptococcaceae bacterium]
MAEFTNEELRAKILEYLNKVDKAKNKDIATAIGAVKRDVDKVINELAKEDILEFLYLGTSYVRIKGKE